MWVWTRAGTHTHTHTITRTRFPPHTHTSWTYLAFRRNACTQFSNLAMRTQGQRILRILSLRDTKIVRNCGVGRGERVQKQQRCESVSVSVRRCTREAVYAHAHMMCVCVCVCFTGLAEQALTRVRTRKALCCIRQGHVGVT